MFVNGVTGTASTRLDGTAEGRRTGTAAGGRAARPRSAVYAASCLPELAAVQPFSVDTAPNPGHGLLPVRQLITRKSAVHFSQKRLCLEWRPVAGLSRSHLLLSFIR